MPATPYSAWIAKCREHGLDEVEAGKLIGQNSKYWKSSQTLSSSHVLALDGLLLPPRIVELERAIKKNAETLARRTLALDEVKGDCVSLKAANEGLIAEVAFLRDRLKDLEGAQAVGVVDGDLRAENERLQAANDALTAVADFTTIDQVERECAEWKVEAQSWMERYTELVARRERSETGVRERVYTLKIRNCIPTILKQDQPGRSQSRP